LSAGRCTGGGGGWSRAFFRKRMPSAGASAVALFSE
jgi:hypothetical protein